MAKKSTIAIENKFTACTFDNKNPAIPAAADEFDGNLENLESVLHLESDLQATGEAWVYTDEAWQMLAYYLAPLQNQNAQAQIVSISRNLATLQQALGVSVEFDRNGIFRTASKLEESADHLLTTVRQWKSRPGQRNSALVSQTQQLIQHCHSIEQGVYDRRRDSTWCRQQCDQAIAVWQKMPVGRPTRWSVRGQAGPQASRRWPPRWALSGR